ncbi:hypothetical protein [Bradyrhizobium sp. sBnM-33]|uniref:hypothetical protein n=1 Tax=Bradyrhizobium sp. sBnM-33 TaxID=2831780 RepID=UPI001BD19878|nr:hypothetical protein [Bradyrhizobium sp. sBnM-33]WOH51832.1 hypothetical protein RX328_06040 [Bradyrhizobium sp. sBnM-33]
MDDPRGEYMFRLEERVAKLEREVEGLQIQSRTTPVGSPDDRVHRCKVIFNSERR